MDKAAYHTHRHVITQIVTHMETCNISMSHRQIDLTVCAMRRHNELLWFCFSYSDTIFKIKFYFSLVGCALIRLCGKCKIALMKNVDIYLAQPVSFFLLLSMPCYFFHMFISRSCHLYSYISSSVARGWLRLTFLTPDVCVCVCVCVGVFVCVCVFLFVYVCARTSTPSIFNPFYLKIKRETGD